MKGLLSDKPCPRPSGALGKITAALLAALLCFTLCACRDGGQTPQPPEDQTGPVTELNVAFDKEDGLNPFMMTTYVNRQLVSLMHRGLYRLDGTYTPVQDIASDSYLSGLSLEVALGETFFFDGRRVNAQDVVYSFEAAKRSPLYSELLSGFSRCAEKNPQTVVFTLKDGNVNALMSLTFPVVKSGTAEENTSKPVSCGYYYFNVTRLVRNPRCADTLPADVINLVEISETDSLPALVDEGKIDFAWADYSGGETVQCASPSTAVYLNSLLYIGLNGDGANMGSTAIRRAVSLGLDRRAVVEGALQGNGRPACVPFNTSWSGFSSSRTAGEVSDIADRQAALRQLSVFGAGQSLGVDGETGEEIFRTIHLTLIYPESNSCMFSVARLVREQLARVFIDVTVTAVPSAEYMETISEGTYDMYVGEIRLPEDMDVSALLSEHGSAAHGIGYYAMDCDEYYRDYLQGDVTMDEFLSRFLAEQPFVPVAFRNGRFFYSSRVSGVSGVTESLVFGAMDQWSVAE